MNKIKNQFEYYVYDILNLNTDVRKKYTDLQKSFEIIEINQGNAKLFSVKDFLNASALLGENRIVLGIVNNGHPVAFGAVFKKGCITPMFKVEKHDAYLEGLYTFEDYRKKGIMKVLISELLHRAETDWGIESVVLCVRPQNISANKCYKDIGFQYKETYRGIRIRKMVIPHSRI